MKNIFSVLLLIWLAANTLTAQESDLSYEQTLIKKYQLDSINYDYIGSLVAIDSSLTSNEAAQYKNQIDRFIQSLPLRQTKEKKEKKRIQEIYDLTHTRFFKKYEEVAYFPEIFTNGNYNCVSATALYAYIFDEIDVPYAIKEYPGHVYMIAYPYEYKIQLETTAPGVYGFSAPKDKDVQETVEELIKLKIVTPQEVKTKGYSKVFMDYFYGEDSQNKAALIGMQYYNKGLQSFEDKKYEQALAEVNKSLIYFPYAPATFFKRSLIFLTLETTEFNSASKVRRIVDAFSDLEYKTDYYQEDIGRFIYKITSSDDNDNKFIESTIAILATFKDKELNSFIKKLSYEYLARNYAQQGISKQALRTSDSLLIYNPKSKIAKDIIGYSTYKELSKAPLTIKGIEITDTYITKYPFLKNDARLISYRAFLYGKIASELFASGKPKEGQQYFDLFQNLIQKNRENIEMNPSQISWIFESVARHYYRNNDFEKCLPIITKGLEFSPESKELIKLKKWTLEEMN